MNTAKTLTLWSLRYSPAKGSHYVAERQVTEATCQDWLRIFREDEPNVIFICTTRKPSIK